MGIREIYEKLKGIRTQRESIPQIPIKSADRVELDSYNREDERDRLKKEVAAKRLERNTKLYKASYLAVSRKLRKLKDSRRKIASTSRSRVKEVLGRVPIVRNPKYVYGQPRKVLDSSGNILAAPNVFNNHSRSQIRKKESFLSESMF